MARQDITLGTHKAVFPSKVNSAMKQGGHIFNVTLVAEHDNGDLIKRETDWDSFDNYAESATAVAAADFTGVVQGESTSHKGYWYVEVLTAADDVVLVYNSPVSPYVERKLQDEQLFVNEIGDVVQGMELSRGDIIELSANAFAGTPAAKASVTYNATTKKYTI